MIRTNLGAITGAGAVSRGNVAAADVYRRGHSRERWGTWRAMRVTYSWTEPEWREAVALSSGDVGRRPVLSGLTWAFIGIPLIGGAGELVTNLRKSRHVTLAGSIVPLVLLLLAAVAGLLLLSAHRARRRKQAAIRASMPAGAWEAVVQETGWRFIARPASTAAVAEETTGAEMVAEPMQPGPLRGDAPDAGSLGLRPWSEIVEARHGERVIVLMLPGSSEGIPIGRLTPEQGGHLYRLIMRKIRPMPAQR